MSDDDFDWIRVVSLSELAEGEVTALDVDGRQIAVYRLEDDGDVYATDNICTHAMALLSDGWLEGDIIECPLHGGCFNVRTGEGQGEPITTDLRTYPVRVSGEDVLLGFKRGD